MHKDTYHRHAEWGGNQVNDAGDYLYGKIIPPKNCDIRETVVRNVFSFLFLAKRQTAKR